MKKIPNLLLNGRVIGKPIDKEEEMVGAIVIPKTANAELSTATIVKFDPALKEIVKEGHIAVYPTGSGMGSMIGGESHIFLNIGEIWAIDEPEQI